LSRAEGTRDRIVRILLREGSGTVDGLSKALGLAPATVRRHLDILQRDDIVTFTQVRKATGRPEYSFSLTETGHETLPRGYDLLLADLLEELGALGADDVCGRSGAEIVGLALRRMGVRAASEYSRQHADVARDLQALLESRNVAPTVARRDGGLHIRVNNCPFRSVARLEHAVCIFCSSLISTFVGAEVRRESGIAHGADHCSYVVPLEPL